MTSPCISGFPNSWALLRRRLTTAFTALAVALTVLVAPQLMTSASAITYDSTTAHTFAHKMLYLMNAERLAHDKRALHMSSLLILSAHRHNVAMAKADVMSHQLPGEASFDVRISRTGYRWRMVGENIGWNSEMTVTGLLSLQRQMYGERLPGEIGHRLNILNRHYRQVGIDVYFDLKHHKVWFTQDFGQPA